MEMSIQEISVEEVSVQEVLEKETLTQETMKESTVQEISVKETSVQETTSLTTAREQKTYEIKQTGPKRWVVKACCCLTMITKMYTVSQKVNKLANP